MREWLRRRLSGLRAMARRTPARTHDTFDEARRRAAVRDLGTTCAQDWAGRTDHGRR